MPDHCNPSFLPYWKRNIVTGEIIGYYVDLLQELSRYAGFNYTINKHCEVLVSCSGQKIQKRFKKEQTETFRNKQEPSGAACKLL